MMKELAQKTINRSQLVELTPKPFDYNQLNEKTAAFLKAKENAIRTTVSNSYTIIGQYLKEAQDELALKGYGCFWEWLESIGIKRQTAYNLIQRYNLIIQNLDIQNLIEDLPLALSYEISKPSTDPEIVKKVFVGNITSHKQYQEALRAKKEAA
jgi:hypothetical protein